MVRGHEPQSYMKEMQITSGQKRLNSVSNNKAEKHDFFQKAFSLAKQQKESSTFSVNNNDTRDSGVRAFSLPTAQVCVQGQPLLTSAKQATQNNSTKSTGTDKPLKVHRVCAGSSFINLKVGGRLVKARIDSGAEITILSTEIYNTLKEKPNRIKDVVMQMADGDKVMQGFITKPVQLLLGSQVFRERLYVAPIADEMLLGHDIMHHLRVLHDMQADNFIVNGEKIPIMTYFEDRKPVVARVSLTRKVVVPPNSVVRVCCQMDVKLDDYYLEPGEGVYNKKVLMPHIVRSSGEKPIICLVNATDNYKT